MTRARDVANLIGSGNYSSTTFTATAGQTAFTISHTQGFVQVFMNGLLLDETVDYTSNGSAVTLTSGAAAGDEIEVVAYNTFSVGDALNQAAADTRYVNATGDTMSGNLTTTAKIGIGTASPSAPLQIEFSNNDGGVSGQTIKNTNTGTTTNFASVSAQAVNGAIQGIVGSANYAAWGGAITFAGSQTNHPFKILTNNAPRVTVDAAGRVTTPYQPMFHAMNSTNDTFATGDAKHNFNSERIDVGGNFDTTNSRFVAPITGYYFFTWGGTIVLSSGDAYITSYLRKNGSVAGGMRTRTNSTSSSTLYAGMAGAEVQYMAANDYMEVYHYSQNGNAASYQNEYVFTGFLIG